MAKGAVAIGVDVGGSFIKVAAVDVGTGTLVGKRLQIATPRPSTPERVIRAIVPLVVRASEVPAGAGSPVGVGMPCVVVGGRTMTAANIDHGWIGHLAESGLAKALARRVAVVNDADAAGVAEMRFGAGAGRGGTVMVITLGTGVGSAIFVDGRLVPNTELGHLEFHGDDAEHRVAAVVRTRKKLSWAAWTAHLDEYLHVLDRLLWPDVFILGGGISADADRFIPNLTVRPPVIPALMRNDAGIVGAALVAADRAGLISLASID